MEIYLSPWILLSLPSLIIFYQHCLRDYQKLQTKMKSLINENEKCKYWQYCFINEIVAFELSATHIPLSIFTNLFHKRFEKHSMLESMLEILQQFYIQMEIDSNWRFFLIHLKVCEMLHACYCCWFNWKNSITCTHWNVILLEHDSIPWQAKSQRINVDATTFPLLWQLFTIIKIFSSTF